MTKSGSLESRKAHGVASLVNAYKGARAEYHQIGLALFKAKHDGMTPREWAKAHRKGKKRGAKRGKRHAKK